MYSVMYYNLWFLYLSIYEILPIIFFVCKIINFYKNLGCERDDNEYSRPNKVAILNQNRDHLDCSQSKKSKFKSNYYSGNQFHKSWQNKADLVREQLNGEFFQRNKQIFRNR